MHRQRDAVDEQGEALLLLFLAPRKYRGVLWWFLLSLSLGESVMAGFHVPRSRWAVFLPWSKELL